ncbi:hypothetical protein L798_13462 [Zootermopsis nevadensis]|uniref:Uncharacterized protein n=1 Tax=Zootermopsis nevadensis TaxID=136037 RepID=A0A067QTX6_ZOONE|nr:hypothetical protein L798_13462 [Zootermopsis nevadensis]
MPNLENVFDTTILGFTHRFPTQIQQNPPPRICNRISHDPNPGFQQYPHRVFSQDTRPRIPKIFPWINHIILSMIPQDSLVPPPKIPDKDSLPRIPHQKSPILSADKISEVFSHRILQLSLHDPSMPSKIPHMFPPNITPGPTVFPPTQDSP